MILKSMWQPLNSFITYIHMIFLSPVLAPFFGNYCYSYISLFCFFSLCLLYAMERGCFCFCSYSHPLTSDIQVLDTVIYDISLIGLDLQSISSISILLYILNELHISFTLYSSKIFHVLWYTRCLISSSFSLPSSTWINLLLTSITLPGNFPWVFRVQAVLTLGRQFIN